MAARGTNLSLSAVTVSPGIMTTLPSHLSVSENPKMCSISVPTKSGGKLNQGGCFSVCQPSGAFCFRRTASPRNVYPSKTVHGHIACNRICTIVLAHSVHLHSCSFTIVCPTPRLNSSGCLAQFEGDHINKIWPQISGSSPHYAAHFAAPP